MPNARVYRRRPPPPPDIPVPAVPIRTFLVGYAAWDAHAQIGFSAAVSSTLVVVPGVKLGVVRFVALPITGALLVAAYRVSDGSDSLLEYFLRLNGLKQVTVASLPATVFVFLSDQSLGNLLQLAYWMFGIAILVVLVGLGVQRQSL